MISPNARRFALVLALATSSLAFAGVARADGVTGTDPVPKGCGCTGHVVAPAPTPSAPATTDSSSPAGAVMQTILTLLGLA